MPVVAFRAVLFAEWLAALAGASWHHDTALACLAAVGVAAAAFGLRADWGDVA